MVGDGAYTSVVRLAAEGVVRLEGRTRCGDLFWRPTAPAPVARFVAEDDGVRYTLTAGRDGLPTVLTAFDTTRRLLLWKASGTFSALRRLERLVATRFAPEKSPAAPDMSRVVLFPLRRVASESVAPPVERSA